MHKVSFVQDLLCYLTEDALESFDDLLQVRVLCIQLSTQMNLTDEPRAGCLLFNGFCHRITDIQLL